MKIMHTSNTSGLVIGLHKDCFNFICHLWVVGSFISDMPIISFINVMWARAA
jgi:hypothetical protein